MKKLVALIFAFGLIVSSVTPAHAARVFVSAGFGGGYYGGGYGRGYYPGYAYGYPGYGYPGYYEGYYGPPPVVYAPAPQVVYAPPPVIAATPNLAANQTSPTFTDAEGRTCRQYQTTAGVGPAGGTACLMADGTWQTVP